MRVLAVRPGPHFSVQDVYKGWLKAFRQLGLTVVDFNFDDRLTFYENAHIRREGAFVRAFPEPNDVVNLAAKGLEAAVYEVWPDVIFVVSGFYLPDEYLDVLMSRGHTVVLLHTESPYEDSRQLRVAGRVSVNVVNDPTNLEQFKAENQRSVYLPHAYDPDVHRPDGDATSSDFCFVGTGFRQRREFFERVDWTGIDAKFAGNWQQPGLLAPFLVHGTDECLDNVDAARLYRGAKASANLYRREVLAADSAEGWSMGPREVELAACGTFFLRDPRPEGDALLPMLPTFTDPDGFGDQLRWWLDHESEREKAAEAARLAVRGRTFVNNAASLLSMISKGA